MDMSVFYQQVVIEDVKQPERRKHASLAGLTRKQMREKTRHERRVEMAFEGQRYFDLKRWKIIGKVMNNFVEPSLPLYRSVFEDRFYLWPLPQNEIDKNRGVLVQNPNYK